MCKLLFFIHFSIFLTTTICSYQSSLFSQRNNGHFRNKRNSGSDTFHNKYHVEGVANAFSCNSDNICLRIVEYWISSNSINCYEIFIPITFEAIDKENKTVEYYGYVSENGNLIRANQEHSNICRKIKR